jgi:trigger factor
MQVQKKQLSDTKIQLSVTADDALLERSKKEVLEELNRSQVKIQGFRKGKAPLSLIEKSVDPAVLQSEFLDVAVNKLYSATVNKEKVRPVSQPEVVIKKFVPFTTLEVTFDVEVIGEIKLPEYSKIKLQKKPVTITEKDVDEVIDALRVRSANKKEVDRPAKEGDEVVIDFAGTDAKSKEPINGADGKDYPLIIGSNTFIPGFEGNLVGVKPGEEKSFDLTFPKDYGVSALQNRKVTFKSTVKKVNEIEKPKVDDAFAATVGPFKSLEELRTDINKQIQIDREQQTTREHEDELISKITEQSKVAIPKALVDDEIDRIESEERQNLMYRGQTWQEHLKDEGVTAEEHREQKREAAEKRVKAGLVLSEIADREKIGVAPEELEVRIQMLKGQYQDKAMQAELDKPSNRREIAARMATEKTIQKLTEYASK